MKNFTQSLSGYCHDFAKNVQKAASLKSLLRCCFLLCPLFSFAGKPGFSPAPLHSATTDSLQITETIRTNLYLLQADGSTILADGVFTIYNNLYHDSVTLEDAAKFTNILENIGMVRYGKTLAVERRPIIQANDTIFYKLWKTTQRAYQIEVVTNMTTNAGLQAFFIDSYLNTSTPVALGDTTIINFSVNGDAGSSATNRFKIIFKPKAPDVQIPLVKPVASKKGSFIVYPNPVKSNTINLQITDQVYGIYQIRLINTNGQTVYTNKLTVNSNTMLQSVNAGANLPKGIYQLEIKNADKPRQVKTILVQ